MKKVICLILVFILGVVAVIPSFAEGNTNTVTVPKDTNTSRLSVNAKSAVLMDAETGQLLYAKNPNEALPPASVTKVMTLLLVAEAIAEGKIKLEDNVTVSTNAASMGGSQIFLKEGEVMTVDELLKSTVIASANDAAVALGELVAGSESAFVGMMNERAKELGLKNTYFENPTGLDDTVTRHLTSAYDVALMSKELIKHECILKYSGLWQDTVRNGEFTLTNTNRLVRYYSGCTGLKTGSTDKAGFCVSATAKRDGMHLIAVVMGSATREERNEAARSMLDFGFANFGVFKEEAQALENVPVLGGTKDEVTVYSSGVSILTNKTDVNKIEKKYSIPEKIYAPLNEGDVVGEIVYVLNGEEIGRSDITVKETIEQIGVWELFVRMLNAIIVG